MSRNPTVREIAEQTGVSTATVSRVLNNRPGISAQARRLVLQAVNVAGYRCRSSANATFQVALVYVSASPGVVLRGFEADLAAGLYQGLIEQQAQLALTSLADKRPEETYTQFFLRKHIDGIVLRVSDTSRHIARQITKEGFPCVVASDRFEDETISFVDYDSRVGMARAMDHLAQLGHQRIGLALHARNEDTDHRDRFEAYREGLQRHGLAADEALIIPTVSTTQGGASVVDQFLAMPHPPTAIVFTNPPPTIGGVRRALQRGLSIPGDLAIVGYDNADLRHTVFPSFSAVCQDAERIGQLAARAVMQRIQDRGGLPVQVVVPTLFEANETTGSPKRS